MEDGLKQISVWDKSVQVFDQGEGVPILLVHGFPLDHTMWIRQIEHLRERFRVIVPDLPGFGRSDPLLVPTLETLNSRGAVTMERMADWLSELLFALQISEPVVFCGLSMGGYIGWQFAKNHRSQISKLVACNTRAASDNEVTRRGRLMAARQAIESGVSGNKRIAEQMLPKLFGETSAADADETNWRLVEASILGTAPSTIAAAHLGMSLRPDMEGWLGEIDFPTLFVAGANDEITPSDEMMRNADAVANSRYVCFENAGHLAPIQAPEEFHSCLDELIGSELS